MKYDRLVVLFSFFMLGRAQLQYLHLECDLVISLTGFSPVESKIAQAICTLFMIPSDSKIIFVPEENLSNCEPK